MTTTLLAKARALAPLVEGAAASTERSGVLDAEVADALADAGLLHALVPIELGGEGLDIVATIEIFEELARQDGSTGWSVMAAAASTAFAAIYTTDDVADSLFGHGRRPVMAGQLSPRGRAVAVDGGYQVSGTYQFGSGSDRASHMLGGCLAIVDGAPVMRPGGLPEILAVIVPREQVSFLGNWDVMGLAGTASVDYEITSTQIRAGAAFSIFTEEPMRGGLTHRLGVMTITAAGHAGFALGVARRALDEIALLAASKVRMGEVRLADQQAFQVGYARAEAKVRASVPHVVASRASWRALGGSSPVARNASSQAAKDSSTNARAARTLASARA